MNMCFWYDQWASFADLPITAECNDMEENDGWSLFLQVKLKNTQVKHAPLKISWREISNGI